MNNLYNLPVYNLYPELAPFDPMKELPAPWNYFKENQSTHIEIYDIKLNQIKKLAMYSS